MYRSHFDKLIDSGSIPKSTLLYGDETLLDSYAKKILDTIGESEEDILSFYFDEYSFDSAKNHISQPSLFGNLNILYIKSDKKLAKNELEVLISLAKRAKSSYFLYQFCGDDKVGAELAKSFTKKSSGDFVRFFRPNLTEAINSLKQRSNQLSLEIDSYALNHLFMLHNENLSISLNELDKLAILNKKITSSDIDRHVYGLGEINIDSFILKVLKKEDIRDDLLKLLNSPNFDEIKIVNAIQRYIVWLFMFHIYIKIHGRFDAKDILGFPMPSFLAQKMANEAIKINIDTYQKVLKELLDSELRLKNMVNIDKSSYLFSSLIKLQSYF